MKGALATSDEVLRHRCWFGLRPSFVFNLSDNGGPFEEVV